MDILEFKELSIKYPCGKMAVNRVSFSVPEGGIVAIVGESGSGKSTLLRSCLGLLPAGGAICGGEICYRGQSMGSFSQERLRHLRGEEISMIFQNAGKFLNPRRKIGSQYLEMLHCHRRGSKKENRQLALEMLGDMKLADTERIMNSYPFELSGGMLQRVAIAMAMSLKPGLLLADEPTSALDVTVQAQVVQEMLRLRERFKTTIVIVTHNMGVAARMADKIAVMQNGCLMEFGDREQVIKRPESGYTRFLLSAVPVLKEDDCEK